jgi:hypothetical protein
MPAPGYAGRPFGELINASCCDMSAKGKQGLLVLADQALDSLIAAHPLQNVLPMREDQPVHRLITLIINEMIWSRIGAEVWAGYDSYLYPHSPTDPLPPQRPGRYCLVDVQDYVLHFRTRSDLILYYRKNIYTVYTISQRDIVYENGEFSCKVYGVAQALSEAYRLENREEVSICGE